MSGNQFELEQEFSDAFPIGLVVGWRDRVLGRFDVEARTGEDGSPRACARVSLTEIEEMYRTARRHLAADAAAEAARTGNEVDDAVEFPTLILQIAWVFEPSSSAADASYLRGYIHDGWIVPAKRASAIIRAAGGSEDLCDWICWAGNSAELSLSENHRLPSEVGVAEIRGNRFNSLIFAVGEPEATRVAAYADSIDVQRSRITVAGRIGVLTGGIDAAEFVWKAHATGSEFLGPATLQLDEMWTLHDAGRKTYLFTAEVVFDPARWDELVLRDNFDAYLRLRDSRSGEQIDARLTRVPFLARLFHTESTAQSAGGVLTILPYFTFKAKALSARVEFFPTEISPLLDPSGSMARRAKRVRQRERPIWIIGELPYKAQDNGMHFYRWMREHHPEIDAYYVLQKDSPERKNLGHFDHVIDHGSREHFELALAADKFVGTHHVDYLYPTQNPDYVKHLRGTRVFLQHGVMGTKWMVPNYGKDVPGFATDLFITSSEYEKSYIVSDFGYDEDEVVVTGLPRFDRLLASGSSAEPGTVLVMPTWRDWLRSAEDFTDTEYFTRWHGLLTSDAFTHVLQQRGLTVTLCLHPNMQRYSHLFEGAHVRVVYQGEEDVQSLMMRSACMITDYSSVGFDFSFQERPVIYFQFDRTRFIGKYGSHINLDAELPGYVCFGELQVTARLDELAAAHFVQPEALRDRSQKFLAHRDTDHSRRVYEAISATSVSRRHYTRPGLVEARSVAFKWYRRSGLYYPSMKAMYRVVRRLPRKRGLVVFESHVGKQYSDSPRYIYEELSRRSPESPKVWVLDRPHRFSDPGTSVVTRLSPRYFWNLARAETWVFNQNAPHYLQRPPKATYIQTWHGTPLKKMQHDLAQVFGRDEGYLDRVTAATEQWTHLLSPSAYATAAFRSAFRYDGTVVELGYPRNDPLVSADRDARAAEIRRAMLISEEQRVVLYAPTFRDDQFSTRGRFTFDLPMDFARFVQSTPDDTILLLRLHTLISRGIEIPQELQGRIRDVSAYDEIQDLLLISDVLVTDYSSVFFDAAVLERPIVFYAYDLEQYRDRLRGFYLDYESDVPGPVVTSEQELWESVSEALDGWIDRQARQEFVRRFNPADDGGASARVVERLILGQ